VVVTVSVTVSVTVAILPGIPIVETPPPVVGRSVWRDLVRLVWGTNGTIIDNVAVVATPSVDDEEGKFGALSDPVKKVIVTNVVGVAN
jgi:hypothetical protein